MSEEKKALIEELGVRLETRLQVAPLAARIYALLTLSSDDGLTFDAIREIIGSSKSSTSVNLNLLEKIGVINFHNKPGDRKRYFQIAKYFQLIQLQAHYDSLLNEMELVRKINSYNQNHFPDKFANEQSLGKITQEYLHQMQELVVTTIQKIETHKSSS